MDDSSHMKNQSSEVQMVKNIKSVCNCCGEEIGTLPGFETQLIEESTGENFTDEKYMGWVCTACLLISRFRVRFPGAS